MLDDVVSIIDDDPSVREGVADLLDSAGFANESFHDADEFLKSGRLNATSCVVADVRMPGISGIELHDVLLRAGKRIPTILITAFPKERDRIRAVEAGVWGYLPKPFGEKHLLSLIRSALQGAPRTVPDLANDVVHRENTDWLDTAPISRGATWRIEELSGPDALEAVTPEWEELDAQVSPRTPFTSPLWAKLWWQHLRQQGPAIQQEFFVHTVRDETGKLLAVAPLVITHRPGVGPLLFRVLHFFGETDGRITDNRCLLCREQDEPRMIQALSSYLYDRKESWDLFVWTGLRHNDVAQDGPGTLLRDYAMTPYYLVLLPDSWEEFRAGLSANMKEAIRKCYKHLARDGHGFTFRTISRPEDIPISLERLLALHSERAQFKYSTRHRDLFAKAPHRAFIADVSRLMAERNQLRIFELEVDGEVLASRMAFLLGDELYLYFSGYDLDWRKHSIMTTLMCECFKWAIERGIKVVNLSNGNDASKIRWRGRVSALHDAVLMSPTRRGSLAYGLRKTKKRIVSLSDEIGLAVQGFYVRKLKDLKKS